MMKQTEIDFDRLLAPEGFACACGRTHCAQTLKSLTIASGAIDKLCEALRAQGAEHVFLVTDERTEQVAGHRAIELLDRHRMDYCHVCLHGTPKVLPNEEYVQILRSTCPEDADFILGVGSGVINDLCKMLASERKIPCGIVATAPSMDGYASNSSAMELGGIKTTVYTICPSLIVCDTQIMKDAPEEMLAAGFGDMAAKLISIADWRIAHLITGEYYCERIASLMEQAYSDVINCADGILAREEEAIRCMAQGLVLSGVAMSLAGVSRPASGMEHTISHLLEMFALARGAQPASHGLQVGYGVREALALYRRAMEFTPDLAACEHACEQFSEEKWEREMQAVFGEQAQELIRQAVAEGRNLPEKRLERARRAVENWPKIRQIIAQTLASAEAVETALDRMHIPTRERIGELGYTQQEAENALRYSKDLRARYIFTSLCADIGLEY